MTTIEKMNEITRKFYEFLEASNALKEEGITLTYQLTWTGDTNTLETREDIKKRTNNAAKDAGYRILD